MNITDPFRPLSENNPYYSPHGFSNTDLNNYLRHLGNPFSIGTIIPNNNLKQTQQYLNTLSDKILNDQPLSPAEEQDWNRFINTFNSSNNRQQLLHSLFFSQEYENLTVKNSRNIILALDKYGKLDGAEFYAMYKNCNSTEKEIINIYLDKGGYSPHSFQIYRLSYTMDELKKLENPNISDMEYLTIRGRLPNATITHPTNPYLDELFQASQNLKPPFIHLDRFSSVEQLQTIINYRTRPLSNNQPIAVIAMGASDSGGTLRTNNIGNLLARGYQVFCVEVTEDIQVGEAIRAAYAAQEISPDNPDLQEPRKIDFFSIHAHGTPDYIILDNVPSGLMGFGEEIFSTYDPMLLSYNDPAIFADVSDCFGQSTCVEFSCCELDADAEHRNDYTLNPPSLEQRRSFLNIATFLKSVFPPEVTQIYAAREPTKLGILIFDNNNEVIGVAYEYSSGNIRLITPEGDNTYRSWNDIPAEYSYIKPKSTAQSQNGNKKSRPAT